MSETLDAAAEVVQTNQSDATAPDQDGNEQTYTLTINGEVQTFTQSELEASVMRHADYTRKTQDLANQRNELDPYVTIKEAFDNDAATAIQVLGRHYGVSLETPAAPSQEQDLWSDDSADGQDILKDDPRIAQLEARIESLTTNQYQQEVDKALQALVERHPDADAEAVRRHAEVNGFPSLESAYRDLHFEERNAAYEAARAKKAAEQAIIDEKRAASGVVAPGSGTAVGSVAKPSGEASGQSFADLLRQELSDAGMTLDPISLE